MTVNCPGCGKPLAKKTKRGKYYCESDSCPVIFVRNPLILSIRSIVYKPSTSVDTIIRIEKTHPDKRLYPFLESRS